MKQSQDVANSFLGEAINSNIGSIKMLPYRPAQNDELIHGIPRLFVVQAGTIEGIFYEDKIKKLNFNTGDVVFCSSDGYFYINAHKGSKYFSLSYYGDFVRFVGRIKADEDELYYFHTDQAIPGAGNCLLQALEILSKTQEQQYIWVALVNSLLKISQEAIKQMSSGKYHSARLWVEIKHYIHFNCGKIKNREQVAKKFSLSPGHLSHLIKKFSGKDFTTILSEYRLEYAANLLLGTHKSVDEIAEDVGYRYVSYFISRFKKKYKTTPHTYRNLNIK